MKIWKCEKRTSNQGESDCHSCCYWCTGGGIGGLRHIMEKIGINVKTGHIQKTKIHRHIDRLRKLIIN